MRENDYFLGRNAAGKGKEYAHQGVQPYDGKSEIVKHAYYQWVPFVLFLQGVMFYIPHYLWKIFEDRKIDKITNGLRGGQRIDRILKTPLKVV